MDNLEKIVAEARATFEGISDAARLEQAKARFLGKAGVLTELSKGVGKLPAGDRPGAGALINEAKQKVEALLAARRDAIQAQSLESRLAQEALDVTLPGRGRGRGGIHPVIRTWQRIEGIFRSAGFDNTDSNAGSISVEFDTVLRSIRRADACDAPSRDSLTLAAYVNPRTNIATSDVSTRTYSPRKRERLVVVR